MKERERERKKKKKKKNLWIQLKNFANVQHPKKHLHVEEAEQCYP